MVVLPQSIFCLEEPLVKVIQFQLIYFSLRSYFMLKDENLRLKDLQSLTIAIFTLHMLMTQPFLYKILSHMFFVFSGLNPNLKNLKLRVLEP